MTVLGLSIVLVVVTAVAVGGVAGAAPSSCLPVSRIAADLAEVLVLSAPQVAVLESIAERRCQPLKTLGAALLQRRMAILDQLARGPLAGGARSVVEGALRHGRLALVMAAHGVASEVDGLLTEVQRARLDGYQAPLQLPHEVTAALRVARRCLSPPDATVPAVSANTFGAAIGLVAAATCLPPTAAAAAGRHATALLRLWRRTDGEVPAELASAALAQALLDAAIGAVDHGRLAPAVVLAAAGELIADPMVGEDSDPRWLQRSLWELFLIAQPFLVAAWCTVSENRSPRGPRDDDRRRTGQCDG